MDIGIFYGAAGRQLDPDEVVDEVMLARDQGFGSFWMPQLPSGPDPMIELAMAGAAVSDIELGTGVINVYSRHPLTAAQQALTVTKAVGEGRFSFGIGLSHKPVIEGMLGMSFERPVRYMREFLEVLNPLLRDEAVSYGGDLLTGRSQNMYPGAPKPAVYLAALGPQMLRLAGRMADGTMTWMTGNETLRSLTVPTMTEAAIAAGRPEPRAIVGLPVCCTDDIDATRLLAAQTFAVYGQLPSYRAMLDREGLSGPEDFCIIGNEEQIEAGLAASFAAGADTVAVVEFATNDEDRVRTRACLAALTS